MPYKDPEKKRQHNAAYYQTHRAARDARRKQTARTWPKRQYPFIGVDGEGGNVDGRHEYLLLRAGDQVLETGKPLRSYEILHWLANLPHENRIYVSYYFTYDVTMILRDLPEHIIQWLLDREGRTDSAGKVRRVWWAGFGLDWLPGKEFRVTNGTGGRNYWIVINDVGSFFQCSFVKALEQWDIGTVEMRRRIAASKAKRSGFGEMTKLTRLYNKKECDLLAELMTRFREVIDSVGPRPRQWQGPGGLAAAWLTKYNAPTKDVLAHVPHAVLNAAQASYYGGWFETYVIGPVRGDVYEYDINSAYPAAMPGLPCLLHGRWEHSKRLRGGTSHSDVAKSVCLAYASVYSPRGRIPCIPIRTDAGNIIRPRQCRGWYWLSELKAARKCGATVEVHESWTYMQDCVCRPFGWVEALYYERKRIGKSARGMALKLALNSLYGKMAQSIGNPQYANPIYASLITSATRVRIMNAISLIPSDALLMVATDGIFTDCAIPVLPISDKLGEWEEKEYDSIFLVQPGIYLLDDAAPKTRGIPQFSVIEHGRGLRKHYAEGRWKEPYTVTLPRFLALREAVARGKWDQAGSWSLECRDITFNNTVKKADGGWWRLPVGRTLRPGEDVAFQLVPHDGNPELESVPYGNMIGRWEEIRAWDDDQPVL